MKRTPILIICSMLMIVACNSPKRQISKTAQKYLEATGNYLIDEACNYCTPETADGLRAIDTTLMRWVDSNYIKKNTPAHFTINSISMANDTSAYVCYHKKTPIQEFDDTLKMVLRDGQWKAYVPIRIPKIEVGEQTYNYDSIEAKIASGEMKFKVGHGKRPHKRNNSL